MIIDTILEMFKSKKVDNRDKTTLQVNNAQLLNIWSRSPECFEPRDVEFNFNGNTYLLGNARILTALCRAYKKNGPYGYTTDGISFSADLIVVDNVIVDVQNETIIIK